MGKARGQKFSKGKSKKDTWKKLKHPDLDEFLRVERENERFGVKDKTDAQLFLLDDEGSDALLKDFTEEPQRKSTRRINTRNRDGPLVDFSSLRCNKNLKPDSAVKDPVIKRNPTRLRVKKIKEKKEKAEANSSNKNDASALKIKDPWSEPEPKSVETVLSNEWLTDEAKRNILRNRTVHKVKKPPTQLKAVEAPHPGLSVNPSFVDHQDILKKVVAITEAEILKENKLIRKTAIPKSVKTEAEDDVDVKDEDTDIKTEPESDSDDTKDGILRPKPKTKQQKRKARELNEQQREQRMQKERNKLEADVFRLKTFTKEINKAEQLAKKRLATKIEKKVKREKFGQLDLSRHKFVPLKPEPLLSEEMSGSLLSDAQNGIAGLTMERFKSLQRRNLIEPRVKQRMEKKYKRKRYQRPSEKMEWEKTGMWNGEKLLNPGDRRRRPQMRKR